MSILPEFKVTVIIENMDGRVKKLTVPLAARVDFAVSDTWDLEDGKITEEKSFGLSCYALYDIDRNLVVDEEVMSQTKWEDQIIDQARAIIQQRWMDLETKTVDTTSINIVRGDN
jgi:hypothetical protein